MTGKFLNNIQKKRGKFKKKIRLLWIRREPEPTWRSIFFLSKCIRMCVRMPLKVFPLYLQIVQRNARTPVCASMCFCAEAAVGLTTSQQRHFQPATGGRHWWSGVATNYKKKTTYYWKNALIATFAILK